MKIWLDDVRDAPDDSWIHVKSPSDFGMLLFRKGLEFRAKGLLPHHLLSTITDVSFDHDLGEEQTGLDVAKWFVGFYEDFPMAKIPTMYCHSMNPDGKKNIESIINSFLKSRGSAGIES